MQHPLRVQERGPRRFQVDGTPTDCVMLAIEALMPERPDFVLSGINHGQNMGEDVLYSGTVAAAMEGLILGVPSIALSFAGIDRSADVAGAAHAGQQLAAITALLRHLLVTIDPLPPNTLLNVNLPPVAESAIRGVRLTRLGRRVFSGARTRACSTRGERKFSGSGAAGFPGRASRIPTSRRSRRGGFR